MNILSSGSFPAAPGVAPWRHAPSHQFNRHETFVVTAVTHHRTAIFGTPGKLDLLRDTVFAQAEACDLDLQAWAFLGNHYHFVANFERAALPLALFLPHLHRELALRLYSLDRFPEALVSFESWHSELTDEEAWQTRLHYVHHNPEIHGIVRDAADYRWCSARWFESNATFSFVKAVYSSPLARGDVPDDF